MALIIPSLSISLLFDETDESCQSRTPALLNSPTNTVLPSIVSLNTIQVFKTSLSVTDAKLNIIISSRQQQIFCGMKYIVGGRVYFSDRTEGIKFGPDWTGPNNWLVLAFRLVKFVEMANIYSHYILHRISD